ncbi:MAG: hypothetical protein QXN55_07925 [Candidatus Nitrosotenuis sp.]
MSCKEVCKDYRATKPKGTSRYKMGQKWCPVCGLFVCWDGLYCPCCSRKLRKVPRNSFYKQKMRAKLDN